MKIKLPDTPSDPELKKAMEEIKAILARYDCAGIVMLQSKTHAEFLNHITPSWSCAKLFKDEKGEGIHVKALAKDFPSVEHRNEAIRLTSGMLFGFRDCADEVSRNMQTVLEMLGKTVGIEHVSRSHH